MMDSFLNHQMILMINEVGKEFKKRFDHCPITKILTIEASGIWYCGTVFPLQSVNLTAMSRHPPSFPTEDTLNANGCALLGLIDIVKKSGATLEGAGIVIEKGFQSGGQTIRDMGIHLESLAIIDSIADGKLTFRE